MKFSKVLFAVIASSSVAGVAFGEEAVQAEKKAPIQQLLPNAYGSVEVRHSTLRKMEGDKLVDDSPSLSVRPSIGSTFFDGKLDSYFTLRYSKKPDSVRINKSFTDNETFLTLVKNDIGAIKGYAYTVMAGEDSFADTSLGLYADAAKSLDIVGGSLKLSAYSNPTAGYKSGKQAAADKAPAADRTSLSLKEDDTKVEQQDPSIGHTFGGGVRYAPAAVKGLSFGPSVDFGQAWTPKYEMVETTDGNAKQQLNGYATRSATMTRLVVSYKLSDATTLTSQIRGLTAGYWEEGVSVSKPEEALGYGANRFEARVSLSTNLF
jgi:hypothetical protein